LEGEPIRLMVVKEDLEAFMERGRIRLKDLCNLEMVEGRATYIGNDLSILKEKVKIIHWAPEGSRRCEVWMPDGSKREGVCEPFVRDEDGKIVQFERFGFARIQRGEPEVMACFAHQ